MPVVNSSIYMKDSYFHIGTHPADRRYLHSMEIHSSGIRFLNQSKNIGKITQTSTSLCPSAKGQATYVSGRLLGKPGSRQEAQEQTYGSQEVN